MEAEGKESSRALLVKERNLANVVFSWSLDDILNGDLYKEKVGKIPNEFEMLEDYLSSFVYPLLEETRAEICSKMGSISTAPFGKVISLQQIKQSTKLYYDLMVEDWKHSSYNAERDPYKTKPGDIIAFTEATPGQYLDIQRLGRRWNIGYVTRVLEDCMYTHFEVIMSKELVLEQDVWKKSLYAVFVMNMTTSNRIWKALSFNRNLDVIKEILGTNDSTVKENCKLCPPEMKENLEDKLCLPSYLNKSQWEAIVECIFKSQCNHKSSLETYLGAPRYRED